MSISAAGPHGSKNNPLLDAARTGDGIAFERLVEEYRPYLQTLAKRILGDRLPGDGSDVVQNALRVAFQHLTQFQNREKTALLSWLAKIVRNEALQALRQENELEPLPDDSGDVLAESNLRPDTYAPQRQQAAELLAAVQGLPDDYRTVIELRNFQELPIDQVAQRMGRTIAAVCKLWTQAMDRLAQELGDES